MVMGDTLKLFFKKNTCIGYLTAAASLAVKVKLHVQVIMETVAKSLIVDAQFEGRTGVRMCGKLVTPG